MIGAPIPINHRIPRMDEMPSFNIANTGDSPRFLREAGGWLVQNGRCYVDMLIKCNFSMIAMPYPIPDSNGSDKVYSSGIEGLPDYKGRIGIALNNIALKKDANNNFNFFSTAYATIGYNAAAVGTYHKVDMGIGIGHDVISTDNVYFHITGDYEVA